MSALSSIHARTCPTVAGALLVGLIALSGCSAAAAPQVRSAAGGFQAAVRAGDLDRACTMLSEDARSAVELTSSRPCRQALADLDLPSSRPAEIEVWGDNAQARWAGGALFLAEFGSGWKITGAGCRPRPNQPYACAVRS
ncbi:hypothetical protein [Microlunatus soli]|uniref:Lipoprotein n=1 Tax=Microlunatus soli TaxID=630515 RepID=A0A1H1N1Q0_9ACTN|nr:hypothetical protein [Microlunatus soli]SDR93051.1 hypothetical protein SAMN04489812_0347 [Microlunatus soli]